MDRAVLFFVDGPGGERPFDWTWIDKWCGLYGATAVAIDPEGHYRTKPYPPFCFRSLGDAVNDPAFREHAWVWLDAGANRYLDEWKIPEKAVLCVGDDQYGFFGWDQGGIRAKIRPPNPQHEGEWYAAMVVPLALMQARLP